MTQPFLSQLFSLEGKVAVVTGGTGVLGGAMAKALAHAGAKVGVLGRRKAQADQMVAEIEADGGQAMALLADVLSKDELHQACEQIVAQWGHVDILVNAAGGNAPDATIAPDKSFFDAPLDALRSVFALNFDGTLAASQVFGEIMSQQRSGCIINISSMAAQRAMTRVVSYGAAKAAVENFTCWLAVEVAQKYGDSIRVNAIAPGFFIGEQNKKLLLNEDDSLTPRGKQIINNTPMARFGEPEELLSTLIWLCSPGARFVTGVVVAVDGGFSVYSGV